MTRILTMYCTILDFLPHLSKHNVTISLPLLYNARFSNQELQVKGCLVKIENFQKQKKMLKLPD